MATLTQAHDLAQITHDEIQRYVGDAFEATLYGLYDDVNQIYAVTVIEDDATHRPAWVVVMAKVVDDKVIILEDTLLDKPLYEALMKNGGIPRENIVLAYAGEALPPTPKAD